MGYTINKPNNMYDNTEELKRRSRELRDEAKKEIERNRKHIEEMRKNLAQYTCATICHQPEYVDAYDSQGRSCAKVLSTHLERQKDYDAWSNATIISLRKQVQNLEANVASLQKENQQLIIETGKIIAESEKHRRKKEKTKFWTQIKVEIETIYQKFITWLNT